MAFYVVLAVTIIVIILSQLMEHQMGLKLLVELTRKKITVNLLKLYLAGSSQKCIQQNDLDTFSTNDVLQNKFVSIVMLQKFLNLLIYFGLLMGIGTVPWETQVYLLLLALATMLINWWITISFYGPQGYL